METTLLLCLFALLAGFVDAVGGGGGLIQLPALFILRPDMALPTLLGTNKCSSIMGTAAATWTYLPKVSVHWRLLFPAIGAAFLGSRFGAQATSLLNPAVARPLMLGLLVLMALYTIFKPDLGTVRGISPTGWRAYATMALIGLIIGFYDGFLGPGTGSLLMFAFVGMMKFDFLGATASAKVINLTTNIAALTFFFATGAVDFALALPMAAFNIAGGIIGSKLALSKGAIFVRRFFLIMLIILTARFAWDVASDLWPGWSSALW